MRLVKRKIGELTQQHGKIEGRSAKRHQQIVSAQLFRKYQTIQRFPPDERAHSTSTVESHHGDPAKPIRLDVKVGSPKTKPFIETPVVPGGQDNPEVAGIAAGMPLNSCQDFPVIAYLTSRSDPADTWCGHEPGP